MMITLFLLGVLTRLIPHVPNLTAVGGLSLFAGSMTNKKYGWLLPLAVMLVSDLLLSRMYGYPLWHSSLPAVYGSYVLIWLLGRSFLYKQAGVLPVAGASLLASLIFFLVTNNVFLVFGPSLYPRTLAGMTMSYVAGLPFFGPTLVSDFVTSLTLFGLYALLFQGQGIKIRHRLIQERKEVHA